jgi:hypothetical protein
VRGDTQRAAEKTYAAYQSTAKKWQIVPAITKRCQMK